MPWHANCVLKIDLFFFFYSHELDLFFLKEGLSVRWSKKARTGKRGRKREGKEHKA